MNSGQMKKITLLLVAPLVFCFSCKQGLDSEEDIHTFVSNPFVGVWELSSGVFREFRIDGTGGDSSSDSGPFGDDFSFFIYAEQDPQTTPTNGTLVTVSGSESGAATATITKKTFEVDGDTITLSGGEKLTRQSGNPDVLEVSNILKGEWTATWYVQGGNSDDPHSTGIWSLKYRRDGTVKTYHHDVDHQFENAYTVRDKVLVIFGYMRFSFTPIAADIDVHSNSSLTVTEIQSSKKDLSPAIWWYTKVEKAPWL